nr:immunoglobulin heavy chain junction region [Macaca mulatta]MOW99058.1 immunoglobulin heavy chain junction region [Macaca mulatta]MOW99383.1 immunoglobulin heavy chain junction region [Macaca mulatta]MOW99574.1 immunoglobulin heavy chain junction region [Macaca mulatta]MOW99818.1 immunoglobulin heavy chain junction region [Macaca mulatta]
CASELEDNDYGWYFDLW